MDRPLRRPPSNSAPSALSLGLPNETSVHLPLVPLLEDTYSPTAEPTGPSSPNFYNAPLNSAASSPRAASSAGGPSFVAGGLMASFSMGRMELAVRTPAGVPTAAPPPPAAPPALPAAPPAAPAHFCESAQVWALRFAVHIVLLSIFETFFFWYFVGPTEDRGLLDLVNSYVGATLNECPTWNATERLVLEAFLGLLLNRTEIDAAGAASSARRGAFNAGLLRNSWLYVGGLTLLLLFLSALSVRRRGGLRSLPWALIVGENLALIVMLGLCA